MSDDKKTGPTQLDQIELMKAVHAMRTRPGRIVVAKDLELAKAERPIAKRNIGTLQKAYASFLDAQAGPLVALGFDVDPTSGTSYDGMYRQKTRGLPDAVIKRILIQNDLVAHIVNARATQVSQHGVPRRDRFSIGFVLEPKVGITDDLDDAGKKALDKRIEAARDRLVNCGATPEALKRVPVRQKRQLRTFPQFLAEITRNAVGSGRCAIELVYSGEGDKRQFEFFLPRDAGTIFYSTSTQETAQNVRTSSLKLIGQINEEAGEKIIDPNKYLQDEYAFWQVINGVPRQVFTDEEMIHVNFYPVPDIEMEGYPITPLDTVVSQVTTHLHITTHNRMYFQSGRASRGMIVIQSDEVSEDTVAQIRQQFQALINGSGNAWRMPVFGITPQDTIQWQPIDQGGQRDMEFQYLADMNSRSILAAFQISPEELGPYSYLSRGTNSQALSESSNEWKLEAGRDLGIRPLLSKIEALVNDRIVPLLDPGLEKQVEFRMLGLEADTAEKEATRLIQEQGIHMTTDQLLAHVEKTPLGKKLGGEILLNPGWQAIVDKYVYVGVLVEHLLGIPNASKDPTLAYIRDPFWMQWQQILMQKEQMAQQAQAAQQNEQQGMAGGEGGDSGGGGAPGGDDPDAQPGTNDDDRRQQQNPQGETQNQQVADSKSLELQGAMGDTAGALGKSEHQLDPKAREGLHRHGQLVRHAMRGWDTDSQQAREEILATVDELLGSK